MLGGDSIAAIDVGPWGDMQLFFSRVSAEFQYVDRFFDGCFGTLPEYVLITQQKIEGEATGWQTLDRLWNSLRASKVVVHLIGAQVGARPKRAEDVSGFLARQPVLAAWLQRHELDPALWSYTQWEGMLAAYFQDLDPARQLFIARPKAPLIPDAGQWQDQQAHMDRLRRVSRYVERQLGPGEEQRWVWDVHSQLRKSTQLIPKPRQCLHRHSIGDDLHGRDSALGDLARLLPEGQSGQVAILSGAGRGKTCLAVEFAWRYQHRYSSLLLIRSDNESTLKASLADLARCLKLARADDTDARAEQQVRDWLRDVPGWLLIIDNIDDASGRDAACALLRELGHGHALVTARDQRWPASVSAYKLDELEPEAACDLLLAAGPDGQVQGTREQALSLAQDLGYVANVLTQARAYMRYRDVSVADYHLRWNDTAKRSRLLRSHQADATEYPKSALDTWLTTWDALSPGARQLLSIWSWLSSAPVPRRDWADLAGLDATLPDADSVEEACAELRRFHLLRRSDTDSDAMHPLDQLISRDYQRELNPAPPARQQACDWALKVVAPPMAEDCPEHFLGRERSWAVHAEFLLRDVDREDPSVDTCMQLLLQLSVYARARGDHAQAQMRVLAAQRLLQERGPVSNALLPAKIHRELAWISQALGRHDEARSQAQQSRQILDSISSTVRTEARQLESLWCINLLGSVDEDRGQLDDARAAFAQGEAISRALAQAAPDNDSYRREWSISLNNLGRVDQAKGRLDAARAAFAQGEAIRRALARVAPDNDSYRREWSMALENLGRIDEAEGRLDAARAAFAQGEAISRALAAAAPDNDSYRRDWSISLNNLGRVDQAKGQLDAARAAFAQGEAISRALAEVAPDNDRYRRDWSISLENLGRVDQAKGQLDAARAAFAQGEAIRRALAQAARDNDSYRRDWSISLENLGRVDESQGQLDAARAAFAQGEAISRALAAAAPDNDRYRQDWSIWLGNVGRVNQAQGQLDAARAAFAQSEAISRALAQAAPDNDNYRRGWAISLENLGRVDQAKGQLDAARAAFAQGEAISRALAKAAPDNDSYRRDWAISLENLGRVDEAQGQLDAARAAFAQGEAISRALALAAPDNDSYRREWAISLNNLGGVDQANGRLDAARTAFAQGEAISRALAAATPDNDSYRREWAISLSHQSRVAVARDDRLKLAMQAADLHRDLCGRHPQVWAWRLELLQLLLVVYELLRSLRRWKDAKIVEAEIKQHLEAVAQAGFAGAAQSYRAELRTLRNK
jgi:tetratricopeptide (TPR) repeat protein